MDNFAFFVMIKQVILIVLNNNKGAKMFSKELGEKLDQYHLLKHPFYQVFWNEGKLTREIIKDYAEQYYQHVKAFPRYISATHSICDDIEKRKILLENLQDEEGCQTTV